MTQDGRRLRRERNIDAVLAVILEMLQNFETPTLPEVATRSGVTIRSIYRYFEDLDHAVSAAREKRITEIIDWIESVPPVDHQMALGERVERIVERRLEVEQLSRPLQLAAPVAQIDTRFDREAIDVFESELSVLDLEQREAASAALCWILRPRSIHPLIASGADGENAAGAVAFAVHRLLVHELDAVVQPAG